MQAVSVCFAIDHVDGDHTIDKPADYDFWRDYQPPFWGDRLLSLALARTRARWRSSSARFTPNPDDDPLAVEADQRVNPRRRQPVDVPPDRRPAQLQPTAPTTATSRLVNWPMIDYLEGPVIDVPDADRHLRSAPGSCRTSVLYWLQTEAPRPDGGTGFPGLRLRGDVTGSADGLAQAPYIRESRRIRAVYTVVEQDLSLAVRGDKGAVSYPDSVGVGHVPHRPAPVDRRRQLHRRRLAARSRSRSAR